MKVGYVRVSSVDQNEARQVESLNKLGVERLFIDKMSGKNMERPNLKLMMDFIREGDIVYVHELSRLGRSLKDLLKITDMLQDKKVELVVVDQNIDTTTPAGQLLFVVMAAIAEFERKTIKERQREGIELAKLRGVYKGRKKRVLPPDFDKYYRMWLVRDITRSQLAKTLGISRPVLLRLMNEYKEKLNMESKLAMLDSGN